MVWIAAILVLSSQRHPQIHVPGIYAPTYVTAWRFAAIDAIDLPRMKAIRPVRRLLNRLHVTYWEESDQWGETFLLAGYTDERVFHLRDVLMVAAAKIGCEKQLEAQPLKKIRVVAD